ncbi:MAG: cell division protein FtsQ/DivIB [Clostridiaceae bacterium]
MAIDKKNISHNELIYKRRKKRKIRRLFLLLVVLTSVLITLCYKLPYFNVTNIYVDNNKILKRDFIVETSGLNIGDNVFFANIKNAEKKLLENPYIIKVDISRNLPSTFLITVEERKATYYIKEDNNYYIIDNKGILLEEKGDISQFNLVEIQGADLESKDLGKVFVSGKDKERVLEFLGNLQQLLERGLNDAAKQSLGLNEEDNIPIKKVDFSKEYNIQISYNNIDILCGDGSNLEDKLKKAINIIDSQKLSDKKGYIDLSFEGNPVYYIQP